MNKGEERRDLGFLGVDFQEKLANQLIIDKEFTYQIIDILDPNYFTDENLRIIVGKIKESCNSYNTIPDYEGLKIRILAEISNEVQQKMATETVDNLKKLKTKDTDYIKSLADKFLKQQNLINTLGKVRQIINTGNIDRYYEIEDLIRKALTVGCREDGYEKIYDELGETLADESEEQIVTGIPGFDDILKLSRKDLLCVIAPTGVGKTTLGTRMSNGIAANGNNVLQIFFEDKLKKIKQKHLAINNEIASSELFLPESKTKIIESVPSFEKLNERLAIKKFHSGTKTFSDIKNYIKKLIADGFNIDSLIFDYFQCLKIKVGPNEKKYEAEADIMRKFEALADELNIAIVMFTQGSRESVKSTIVREDEGAGAFAISQIAHKLISISKSPEQKANGKANFVILKNRDGNTPVLEDIDFNNDTLVIDLTSSNISNSLYDFTHDKSEKAESYVLNLIRNKE